MLPRAKASSTSTSTTNDRANAARKASASSLNKLFGADLSQRLVQNLGEGPAAGSRRQSKPAAGPAANPEQQSKRKPGDLPDSVSVDALLQTPKRRGSPKGPKARANTAKATASRKANSRQAAEQAENRAAAQQNGAADRPDEQIFGSADEDLRHLKLPASAKRLLLAMLNPALFGASIAELAAATDLSQATIYNVRRLGIFQACLTDVVRRELGGRLPALVNAAVASAMMLGREGHHDRRMLLEAVGFLQQKTRQVGGTVRHEHVHSITNRMTKAQERRLHQLRAMDDPAEDIADAEFDVSSGQETGTVAALPVPEAA